MRSRLRVTSVFSRHDLSEPCFSFRLSRSRGRREGRVPIAPMTKAMDRLHTLICAGRRPATGKKSRAVTHSGAAHGLHGRQFTQYFQSIGEISHSGAAPLAKSGSALQERPPGEMAEWLKAHAWKACVRETVPWVRIPLSPPSQRFLVCRLQPSSWRAGRVRAHQRQSSIGARARGADGVAVRPVRSGCAGARRPVCCAAGVRTALRLH